MLIEVVELSPGFAARMSGVDLREPISTADSNAVRDAIDRYGVLVFHRQPITDEQQMAFTQSFGELEGAGGGSIRKASEYRLAPAMVDVSNLDKDNKVLARDDRRRLFNLGNQLWHSDGSFRTVPPTYSILSARTVAAKGGNTEFADMRAAYDDLDAATKAEIEPLVCEHSQLHSRGALGFSEFTREERQAFKPVRQRLVRVHPATGRKSLYLSSHIGSIVGWPTPEGRAFIRDLTEHAVQPKYVYAHRWQPDDLVMWDNRQTMHRVRRFDETQPRDMRRTTVAGTAMTMAQADPA
ncbi:MAG: TauD/TfdA family dioxygenase [Rhodospirillales bacterium]|nr:TauD/TfdA family dioxygenase [Rhodospirillales bacterium]